MATDTRSATLPTSGDELRGLTAQAGDAAAALAACTDGQRADFLRSIAAALDAHAGDLVPLADEETALGEPRLAGEVTRTTGQLRLFADVVEEGSYVEAILDSPDPAATPPRPGVRRMLHPLGPVAVFAAGNFPFAFSVAGGDTASALAAGCPVVVKAHRGHPRLSATVSDIVGTALREAGAPEGAFACVSGREIGRELVLDRHMRAVGFTGSTTGGRALFDLAVGRDDPIPFYGELASINPVVVLRSAVERRGQQIAEGLVASFTLGVGQFCTKPGLVLVPDGGGFESLVAAAVPATQQRMLTSVTAEGFHEGLARLLGVDGIEIVAGETAEGTGAGRARPLVLGATADVLRRAPDVLTEECFGPVCVLVRYRDDELLDLVDLMPGTLAAALHAEADDAERVGPLVAKLRQRAGRLVWNGWPTGVAVTWSMHHGGPWPATTDPLHTSVGATAIRRFLRPVAYQDMPEALLPAALRDSNPLGLTRRIDGTLTRN